MIVIAEEEMFECKMMFEDNLTFEDSLMIEAESGIKKLIEIPTYNELQSPAIILHHPRYIYDNGFLKTIKIRGVVCE